MVLISGDNAMGCEYLSHEMLTARLRKLTDAGVKVYTVPGNHDISRPDKISKRFVADDPTGTVVKAGTTYVDDRIVEVKGTTKSEFAELYKDFGYGDDESIIARDPGGSLSYSADLGSGYRLIAVDANEYSGELCTGKKYLEGDLLNWVNSQIKECTAAGDIPLLMMHYDLIEKYDMQSTIMGGNFLDGGENSPRALPTSECAISSPVTHTQTTFRRSPPRRATRSMKSAPARSCSTAHR